MDDETARQHFEKMNLQMQIDFQNIDEILSYEKEAALDPIDLTKEMEQLVINPQLFFQIENDMRDVERNFTNDPALEAFKMKYETLYQAMNTSKENETALMKNCKSIASEISVRRAKFISAIALTREQKKDAEDKKLEIENTFKTADNVVKTIKDTEVKIEEITEELKNVTFRFDSRFKSE